jgi:hypothetical protein
MGPPPAGQGKCYDTSRYVNFFTQPASNGGVRIDPGDVILAAIAGPPSPFQVIVGNPGTNPYQQCAAGQAVDGTKCAVLLQHSCFAPPPNDTTFFGDPGVRLSSVVNSAKHNQYTSICDTDYSSAITALGNLIVSQIGAGCLSSPVSNPDDPDCVVEDVTIDPMTGLESIAEIPSCVRNGATPTCWKLAQNDKCNPIINPVTCMPEQFGIAIDRGPGGQPPANTSARVACATIAHSEKVCSGM